MIKNYFKIAWRNLFRNKTYALINIVGLAVGIAATMLIALWVQNELNYDRIYSTTDRLGQVYSSDSFDGKPSIWSSTPGPLAPALKADYPEIEDAVRFTKNTYLLTAGEKKINIEGAIADPGFFTVFGLPFISGNAATALTNNSGIVITEKLAVKLFGIPDAVGKTLLLDSNDNRMVTAVIKDIPENSRFHDLEYILPYSILLKDEPENTSWTANNYKTYVLVKPGVKWASLNAKIENTIVRHTKDSGNPTPTKILLHPANKWRLYSKAANGKLIDGEISNVWRMGRIAIFILLIACINFMNLSTARSEKRAKEVGVRKVAGAGRASLVFQFLSESIILTFIAAILALLLALCFLPSFNILVGKSLSIPYFNPVFWLLLIAFIFITGILAGSYPAFFLSAFQPIKVLKGTLKSTHAFFNPRKILVVIQFTIAILLIISTIVIKRQVAYAQSRDSGFNKDNLVYTAMDGELKKHYELVKQELINSGVATAVTKSMGSLANGGSDGWGFSWIGSTKADEKLDFAWLSADADFLATTGVKLVAGRDIDIYQYPTDSTAIILNEQAVKTMKLQNPIGAIIRNGEDELHVVGIVKDFILGSPYEPIQPLMIMGPSSWFNYINYKLNPNNTVAQNLKLAEGIFKKYNPTYPFDYKFTDEEYQLKFEGEERMGALSSLFSGLTIFIACLGLFALAAYTTEQRRKEIGVRKVLGAPVLGVAALLSKDFLKLVIIAFFIASPIAWWVMNDWLSAYEYRIAIGWTVFLTTGFISVAIAILTVSFQAIKAALANPIKSLRTE
ncbi:MAG: ABC transporter permease [Pelobium sp.]